MTAFAPLEIPPGTDVRGFLAEQKLGTGGFGTVYRARRGERLYALKFVHWKAAGGWAKREVDILMRLAHPNVVGFEGCGFWPEETREYLVIIMDAHAPDNATTEGNLARADGADGVEHWLREARHAHERPRRGRRPALAAPEGKQPPSPVVEAVDPPGPVSASRRGQASRSGALNILRWGGMVLGLASALGLAVVQLHPPPATSPKSAAGEGRAQVPGYS